MAKIVILGAGMMGSALSLPACDNGHEVHLVGTPLDGEIIAHGRATGYHLSMKRALPERVIYHTFDETFDVLRSADLMICGVSSFGVDWFCDEVLTKIDEKLPVLSVTKGLWDDPDGTLVTFPALYARRLPQRKLNLNAIGGPCTSYELADRRHSSVTFCGENVGTLAYLRDLLETNYYHISTSTDVVGVECAVALKNAYALGVSLAIGQIQALEGDDCTLAYNPQAALFGQSVREMMRLLCVVGGEPEHIMLGAGDLYVTIFGGRTRLLGTLLGKGMTFGEAIAKLKGVTLESVVIATRTARAIRTLAARGKADLDDYPLLCHVDEILNEGKTVAIPWHAFEEQA